MYVCAVCIPTPDYAHHDDQQPTATRHICERWHIRGSLKATAPVVASVGAYDASSRISRQSLGCGSMYVCKYPCILTPDHPHHNDQRPTGTGQNYSSSSSSSRQNHARKVAHPACTLWPVACIGAYVAAPRMDSRQSWGCGRLYSMNHPDSKRDRPQRSTTATRKKKTAVLLCHCCEQQCNSQPVEREASSTHVPAVATVCLLHHHALPSLLYVVRAVRLVFRIDQLVTISLTYIVNPKAAAQHQGVPCNHARAQQQQ